ncbi:hypothetical protein HQN87_11660 [Paenibacillus tritici]|uniref:Uncharacterized protein n=1 Tax=Paenibacillus tritici TaxID=1873425 RepID=A0ABX2DMV0_9BACL|nr:hypothetical protein [Paenibacillus tritici]NQX45988.1 hypothetical protein [Paenibacillus tritici]QUL52790.1 hypothetical protein KDC22_20420 [Paenibacillus tritici]
MMRVGNGIGAIGAMIGIASSGYFLFYPDTGKMQYLIIVLMFLIPSVLALYATLKNKLLLIIVSTVWSLPVLFYFTYYGEGTIRLLICILVFYLFSYFYVKREMKASEN